MVGFSGCMIFSGCMNVKFDEPEVVENETGEPTRLPAVDSSN
jgi:hypothetical protein